MSDTRTPLRSTLAEYGRKAVLWSLKHTFGGWTYPMGGAMKVVKQAPVILIPHDEAFVLHIRGQDVQGKAGGFETISTIDGEQGILDPDKRDTYEADPVGFDAGGRPMYRKTAATWTLRHTGRLPFLLKTLEGPMWVRPGDWVNQGPALDQWPRSHDFMCNNYAALPAHRAAELS